MCLLVFDWQPGRAQWLTLSANRDEFYQRPSRPLMEWPERPGLYAGKDLAQGGTWLGVTETGRWAALTNIRAPGAGPQNPLSRGELVLDYLDSQKPPRDWLNSIATEKYAPFNLLVGNQRELWYLCNHPTRHIESLSSGKYTLSNAHLNTPWPKAKLAMQQLINKNNTAPLSQLLNRRTPWPDEQLPSTGVPLDWERLLSAQFIVAPGYGTRCSTGIQAYGNTLKIDEVSWDSLGDCENSTNFRIVLKDRLQFQDN